MVVDVGVVKNHIKPKADSTLYNMRKVDLIEYIRTLEHNYNVAVSFNENQARYIESLDIPNVVRCKDCQFSEYYKCSETRHCRTQNGMYRAVEDDDFCSWGERREGE
jgi:hypothetical protein